MYLMENGIDFFLGSTDPKVLSYIIYTLIFINSSKYKS